MKTHTPEPWSTAKYEANETKLLGPVEDNGSKQWIGDIIGPWSNQANAARIVECINAMKGIDNPVEFIASIYDVLKECKHQLQLQEPFRLEDTIAKIDKILKQ